MIELPIATSNTKISCKAAHAKYKSVQETLLHDEMGSREAHYRGSMSTMCSSLVRMLAML